MIFSIKFCVKKELNFFVRVFDKPLAVIFRGYNLIAYHFSDFLESFVERRVQLTLLPIAIHNRKTDEAMQRLTKYIQHNRLEYYNFVFFSIVLRREYGKQVRFTFYFYSLK